MAGETSQSREGSETRREQLTAYLGRKRGPLAVYLKGFAMGSAGVVPGVSGGTIALIVGIYDRFVAALAQLDTRLLRPVPQLYTSDGREAFTTTAREMDIPFLLLLYGGSITAIFTLARVIDGALTVAPGPTFAFFGGLIAASAVVLFEPAWLTRPDNGLAAVAGFAIAFVVAGASGSGLLPEGLLTVFLAAAIAIAGMVLPGISGSFLLLLLGQYEFITGTVTSFTDGIAALLTGGSTDGLLADGAVLGVYGVGAVVGFLTTARAVQRALDRYPHATFAFLVSLMIGALRYPVIRVTETTEVAPEPLAAIVVAAVAGGGAVLVLDRYTDDLEYV